MQRIVPGLLIAAFWLLLLLFGTVFFFNAVVAVIVLVGADEYVKMVDDSENSVISRFGLDCIVSFPLLFCCFSATAATLSLSLVVAFGLLTVYFLRNYKNLNDAYLLFARLIFGLFYLGFLGAHVVLLRRIEDGAYWLLIASLITALSDSGAYFTGLSFGKRKLCPHISPKKTVEGAVGGILCALFGVLIVAPFLFENLDIPFLVFCTVSLALVGIAGDLTESIIKRGTGTKDSGTLLAGHGGILDRVDSLLFVVPVLYYVLTF